MNNIENAPSRKNVLTASCLFMGLGHLIYLKQYIKGALFALIELAFIFYIPTLVANIINLITLGESDKSVPVMQRDHSIFMMIDGILSLAVLLLFVIIYVISIKSALSLQKQCQINHRLPQNRRFLSEIADKGYVVTALAPTLLLIVIFVLVPLIFSFLVAFTNYSSPGHMPPNNTVDWVGFDNFETMFGGDAKWTSAFGRVALWTVIWGFAAALTCYFVGLILAVMVNDKKIKISWLFQTIFVLPYAVPSVISMIVWRNMLNGTFGTVNKTLTALGIISTNIPWLSDATLAKFMCIMVNLWAGFPYFMLLALGTMSTISEDVYEAAQIDGANKFQRFFKITLPLVLRQNAPLIILSICHNLNNFGAIFFLTEGDPVVADSTTTAAKGTDIIVTWIYNLTVNLLKYNYAATLAVIVFLVLAPFAIFNFVRTKSYKEGDM